MLSQYEKRGKNKNKNITHNKVLLKKFIFTVFFFKFLLRLEILTFNIVTRSSLISITKNLQYNNNKMKFKKIEFKKSELNWPMSNIFQWKKKKKNWGD